MAVKFQFLDQNDWRIQQLRYQKMDDNLIDHFIKKATSAEISDPKVSILEPGLSGFVILLVSGGRGKNKVRILLKIKRFQTREETRKAKQAEMRASQTLLKRGIKNNVFIPCAGHMVKTKGSDIWLCFVFNFANDKITFRQFFADYLSSLHFDKAKAKNWIRKILIAYTSASWIRHIVETTAWRGTSHSVCPLEQSAWYQKYLENVYRVVSYRPDLARAIGLNEHCVRSLLDFINTGKYQALYIDPDVENVPVAEVHGDLNGGNVLVNKMNRQGCNPVFIDFGQMSREPDRHALYDIGKLSIDFERFILQPEIFDWNPRSVLQAWTDIHNSWLRQSGAVDGCGYEILDRLYLILSVFREFSIEYCKKQFPEIDNKSSHKQFLFVRLHHLLRIINHPYVDEIRKLFAVRAAIDTIEFLQNRPRETAFLTRTGSATCPFDCTDDEFVSHLVNANSVTIIGITNENLKQCIDKAWHLRKKASKGTWKEFRVVFLARHLLKHVIDKTRNGRSPVKRWEDGVSALRDCLLYGKQKARRIDIRYTDKLLPFVGQLYDNQHVRVTFLLPRSDPGRRCYVNWWTDLAPCKLFGEIALAHSLPRDCPEWCSWLGINSLVCRSCPQSLPYLTAVKQTMEQVTTVSTPLFSANVFGRIVSSHRTHQFLYLGLVPQRNWREFRLNPGLKKSVSAKKPTHLMVFVILHSDGSELYLQSRNPDNARDDIGKWGVISGKINDEDFFPDDPNSARRDQINAHRTDIYKLQLSYGEADILKMTDTVARRFAHMVGLKVGTPIDDERLKCVSYKAAIRTIREKLGIDVSMGELVWNPLGCKYCVVDRDGYDLFIMTFGLEFDALRQATHKQSRPSAGLKAVTQVGFEQLKSKNRLMPFDKKYFRKLVNYVFVR